MRDYNNTVGANSSLEIGRGSVNFIYVKSAAAALRFEAEYEGNIFVLEMLTGDVLHMPSVFDSVRVVNDTAGAVTFSLVIGKGDFRREANLTVARPQNLAVAADITCAATAKTLILGANLSRFYATIQNSPLSAGSVRVGDTTVSAIIGAWLAPGESKLYHATEGLYVYNPNGFAVIVSAEQELS